jgi:hypothetical protein
MDDVNPLTLELNPSAQRCLPRFFTWILIFKGLTVRRLYKSFGVRGLTRNAGQFPLPRVGIVYRLLLLLVLYFVQIGDMRSLYQEKLSTEATYSFLLWYHNEYCWCIIGNEFRVLPRTFQHSCRDIAVTGTTRQWTVRFSTSLPIFSTVCQELSCLFLWTNDL